MPREHEDTAGELAGKCITSLETGTPPDGPFTPNVFCDFTMPQWRLQAQGAGGAVAPRLHGHPGPGPAPRSRFDATSTGFALEVEEQWEAGGDSWYCVSFPCRPDRRLDLRAVGVLHRRANAMPCSGEVGAALGLGGRRRYGSADERARVAVQEAIAAALTRFGQRDPGLARLLRDTMHTGASCRYDPDPGRPVR